MEWKNFGEFARAVMNADGNSCPDPRLRELDEGEGICERCGQIAYLEENHGTTHFDGKMLCHDCEIDTRIEE